MAVPMASDSVQHHMSISIFLRRGTGKKNWSQIKDRNLTN